MTGEIYGPRGELIATKESLQRLRIEWLEEQRQDMERLLNAHIYAAAEVLPEALQEKYQKRVSKLLKEYRKADKK